jgi:hypothetical protein
MTHMEKQKLPVEFPHSVRELKTKQLIGLQLDLEKKKLVKKEATAEMNAAIKLVADEISTLTHELDEGTALQDVEVEMRLDMANKLVRYVRTDNGDEVSTRPMDDDDRQTIAEVDGQPLATPKNKAPRRKRGELTSVPD